MIPRIKELCIKENYILDVLFDTGEHVLYDVEEDMNDHEEYRQLQTIPGLFQSVQVDESRTCVYWNDRIDLASDAILEYGKRI